jgi:alpha-beta hydrolase superfamily lysophospholipase
MTHTEFSIDTQDGLQLYGQSWEPDEKPKAVVCLLHGFKEHSSRYSHLAKALVNNAYSMFAIDLRGHGKSQGRRGDTPSYNALLDDIDQLYKTAEERYPDTPCYLYGHSLGGNIALNYIFSPRRKPAGAIISGPWLRLSFEPPAARVTLARIMNGIWPTFSQPVGLETAALSRDTQIVNAYENDPLVHDQISARMYLEIHMAGLRALDHAAKLSVPILLMHGSADRICSPDASGEFAASAGELCTFKLWDGFYHEIHNEPEKDEVFAYLLAWLDQGLS